VGTIFENQIELVSGQKFPDIVAYINQNKAFGVEVKTTKQKKWKSTGSSIFEGTRVPNVENIYLLFGKGCVSFQLKAMAEPVEAGADYATTTSTGSVSVTIPTHLKHTQ